MRAPAESGRRRIVITGAGTVNAAGADRESFWDGLAAGAAPATPLQLEGLPALSGFRVEALDPAGVVGKRNARRTDRAGILGVAAALEAAADAGDLGLGPYEVGCAVACAHGGSETIENGYRRLLRDGADRVSPFSVPLGLPNNAAAAVARTLGLHGPSAAPTTACAAGSDAIGWAADQIRLGRATAMFAGGAEAPIVPFVVAAYLKLGALSKSSALDASRPFDAARTGFVIGEGAGVLVLEEREHALARGARIHAELTGYGQTCDAASLTDPDQTGIGPARAITRALEDAALDPDAIGYVNAHATSTPSGDSAEARAIAAARLTRAAVASTKASTGHCLGGAGGVEAVAVLMAFARNLLAPTATLTDPDDDVGLDHVAGVARAAEVRHALSTSFGFGGHNAALVFSRHA